ncbi:hypothetical protein GQ53DRAFT_832095 [Thozetella sp. PMI_491]|nr:hypothetical protein GQ53DRAFT_832095 [Thozetella sp. PMI_491]
MSRQATIPNATLVYDNGGWIEFLAVRPNGSILLPYTSSPELWSLNPLTGEATLLVNFTGPFTSLTGITEVQPDFYAVLSGNFTLNTAELSTGSWGVWTVDFRGCDNCLPVVNFIRQIPESRFFLAAERLDDDNIFIADGDQGLLYKMNIITGEYSIVLQDISMDRNGGLAGIHGVQYAAPYVYYTNTFRGGYWKLEVSHAGEAIGSPIKISSLDTGDRLEGLAPWIDGSVFIPIQSGGVKRVWPDGSYAQYLGVEPPTDCIFGRTQFDWDVLYICTAFGTVYKAPYQLD